MGGNDFGIPIPILIPPFWILHIIPIPPNFPVLFPFLQSMSSGNMYDKYRVHYTSVHQTSDMYNNIIIKDLLLLQLYKDVIAKLFNWTIMDTSLDY